MSIEISGAVIVRDNALLLLWKKTSGHYELPGGKIEPGESSECTMRREVLEEIGCRVRVRTDLGFNHFNHKGRRFRSHKYLVTLVGEPSIQEPEVFEELIWMPLDQWEEYILAPNVEYLCRHRKKLF